ncbi:AMP-dependent synthetase/ligase [Flavihumibacter sp.]|uniref:AMP-dependent synthetase/ligase n=1 Tax=Flavihumibacter sp. TaxID=1913981 RepID=UPI002FCC1E1B
MDQPKRLFDCIEYQLEQNPDQGMMAAKENGQWRTYSVKEVSEMVNKLSGGLLNLGISCGDMTEQGRDKVAILSKNRPEWMMVDLAVQQIGAVLTPFYPTINVKELEFVLNDAQVKLAFVNDEDLYLKLLSVQSRVPSLKHIFTFEHVANAAHWKDVIHASSPDAEALIKGIADKIKSEDLATIIYTSGTTGTPKGVMLSHNNILSNVMSSINPVFTEIGVKGQRSLSFLPLNHIFERMVTYIYMFSGTHIYYAESLETIGDNLKEVQPSLFTTVPRLLEKVYEKIMVKGMELEGIKKKLFYWAHDLADKYNPDTNQGVWYKAQLSLANKLVFSKWREALGGNIKAIVSGGAACQVKLIRIFTAAKIPILEGYGLTETSPVISVNRYTEAGRKFGTVGLLLDDVEVKIAEDGEILSKGPHIMMGYYKRPDLTAEVIKDGWFSTGDIGMIVDNKFLKITDRKKEMFKTSGGKYVAPLPIENRLKESLYVEQLMVLGADKKFVSALIVPSFPNLKDWCRQNNIAYTTNEEMIRHPKVVELYKDLVENFNKYFNQVEQIKKFELLPLDWSIDTGELTPKMSLKRKVIMEKYQDAIERIYT